MRSLCKSMKWDGALALSFRWSSNPDLTDPLWPERVCSLTAASDASPGTLPSCASLCPRNAKSTLLINLYLALFMSHYHVSPSNTFQWLISFLFLPRSLLPRLRNVRLLPASWFLPPSLTQLRVGSTEVQTLDWQSAAARTTAASWSFPINPVYWTIFFPGRRSEVVRRAENLEARFPFQPSFFSIWRYFCASLLQPLHVSICVFLLLSTIFFGPNPPPGAKAHTFNDTYINLILINRYRSLPATNLSHFD